MAELTRTAEREPEPQAPNIRLYEPVTYEYGVDVSKRQRFGRVVVKGSERPWDMHRQANSKRYLSPLEPDLQDTVLQAWDVFLQWIPEKSGRHRHQGGIVIFILEGAGYTVMDGVKHPWKAGDLMLLPFKPGGIEHQHFNANKDQPVKWIAFQYWPWSEHVGCEIAQLEDCPWYIEYMKERTERLEQFAPEGRKRG